MILIFATWTVLQLGVGVVSFWVRVDTHVNINVWTVIYVYTYLTCFKPYYVWVDTVKNLSYFFDVYKNIPIAMLRFNNLLNPQNEGISNTIITEMIKSKKKKKVNNNQSHGIEKCLKPQLVWSFSCSRGFYIY